MIVADPNSNLPSDRDVSDASGQDLGGGGVAISWDVATWEN